MTGEWNKQYHFITTLFYIYIIIQNKKDCIFALIKNRK